MTPETKDGPASATVAIETEEFTRLLPAHLTENFEKAHHQIQEYYGTSPGVPALIRLWLACATSTQVRLEFERAVLDITKRGLNPHEEEYFDDSAA
ncbi:MAG: hypothetical protein JNN01_19815 [Opitutaceae bacterium]|nr:hypothetical protein [Opitutaceae bacterium]